MSQANIPNITPNISLTREESINLILSSIALQELGLAHIINAEGEKIQYALGLLTQTLSPPPTFDQLIQLNKSVQSTLQGAVETEIFLKAKLEAVLQEPSLTGPPGPTGPTGPAGGPVGATGATGATGALTAVRGTFYTQAGPTVAAGSTVPLTNSLNVSGGLSLSGGCIQISTSGIYQVTYIVTPQNDDNNNPFSLTINGTLVTASTTFSNSSGRGSQPQTWSEIINLNAGDILCIRNSGTVGSTTLTGTVQGQSITSAGITLFKLD